ncbi:MAG: phosphate regulon sensor histidine kinase PhoR, partial [Porticoccaceae bacterium]|nr:phosphate regulon sensor histidine kinase PhoR [Porticoccaceae bacterium]
TINRTTRMTEALDEGMLVLNSDLSLDWWNNAAEGLVGLRSTDRGSAIFNLIRDPKFVEYITNARFVEPIQLPSSLRTDRLLEFSGSHFGQGEIVLIVKDITRLDSLEQLRKEFVANVSHELRTPLTVIKGYIETLREVSNSSLITDRAFDNISAQANKMQSLADNLILLSKLESEAQPKTFEYLSLKPVLTEIVVDAEQLSDGKHRFEIDCDEEFQILARANDMRSALGNILFNAVRHNPAGAKILIQASEDDGNSHICVRDDGIGIDPSEIPRITERFYRIDSSRSSHSGGTGLGLAIVKHTLNLYGGSLIIKSGRGKGAEFICRLPKL